MKFFFSDQKYIIGGFGGFLEDFAKRKGGKSGEKSGLLNCCLRDKKNAILWNPSKDMIWYGWINAMAVTVVVVVVVMPMPIKSFSFC